MQLDTDKLKRQMTVRFISGAKLAEATGITRQSIYRILRGDNQPKPENFKAICEALECDPRDLLADAGQKPGWYGRAIISDHDPISGEPIKYGVGYDGPFETEGAARAYAEHIAQVNRADGLPATTEVEYVEG